MDALHCKLIKNRKNTYSCRYYFTQSRYNIVLHINKSIKPIALPGALTIYSRALTPGKILQVMRPRLYVELSSSVNGALFIIKRKKIHCKKENEKKKN